MPPRIFIVAGPPGGGKSTAFPVSEFGVDFFDADDHAAALNQGSYLDIPVESAIRSTPSLGRS
jgi:dephospho-CoA kinase